MPEPPPPEELPLRRLARPRRPPTVSALPVGHRRRWLPALAALAVGDAALAFQQTAVIPALPTIGRELGAGPAWTAWLVSGYLVVAAVAAPFVGKLGDRHGKQRLLVVSLAVFFVGSIGAALAPGIWALIAFRAMQGAAGAIFPLSFSIARDEAPDGRVGIGIGILTGAFGLGSIVGYGFSGVVVGFLGWRWLFALGAVVVLAAAAVVLQLVPRSPVRTEAALDGRGAALLGGGLAGVLVALTTGANRGWLDAVTLAVGAAAALSLGAWARHELRVPEPLLALGVLRRPAVLYTNAASFLAGGLAFAVYFLVPHLARDRLGAGAVAQSLYLVPAAAGLLLTGPLAGALGRRRGAKLPFVAGMVVSGAGTAWLALWHSGSWTVAAGVLLVGAGAGLAIGAAGALIAQAVSPEATAVTTALNSDVRLVGGGIGTQAAAALLAGVGGVGYTAAFWVATGLAAAATGLAALVPGRD